MSKSLTDLKIAVQMVQRPTTLILEASQLYHYFLTCGTQAIGSDPQAFNGGGYSCTTTTGTLSNGHGPSIPVAVVCPFVIKLIPIFSINNHIGATVPRDDRAGQRRTGVSGEFLIRHFFNLTNGE